MSTGNATTWYLKASLAGGAQANTLSGWGIENPQVTFRSLADDDFTFEIKTPASSAPTFPYGTAITLYKTAAGVTTPWFVGTVVRTDSIGTFKTEQVRYTVKGPWFQLRRLLFTTAAQFYNAVCQQVALQCSKVVLFQDPVAGGPITTGVQIQNVINFAVAAGVGIAAGSLPAFINVPTEETRDLTCADVIRRAMRWTPDGVGWFDYSSGVPVFNASQRAGLTTRTIDLSQDNLVSSFSLTPRSDLVPVGVLFNYLASAWCNVNVPNGCVDPSTGITNTSGGTQLSANPVNVQTVTQDTAGITTIPGAVQGSIDLVQLTPTTYETAPIGLAASYYLSLVSPTYDGTITTHEYECSGNLRPGKALNLLNGQAVWATMAAQIQEVRESLYDGITTATVGTPGHLQPQNFNTLLWITQHRPLVVQGFAAVATGGSANGTNCQQGQNPETKKLLNKLSTGTGTDKSGSTAGNALGSGAGQQMFSANTCAVNVCVGGVLTPMKFYCPPQ